MRRTWPCALLAMVAVACSGGASPEEFATDSGLAFASATSMSLDEDEEGGVFEVRVHNDGPATVLRGVRPIVEPGLVVDFLGWSSCDTGCPGAVYLSDPGTSLEQADPQPLPVVVPHTDGQTAMPHLIFALRPANPDEFHGRRACLAMTGVVAGTDDGSFLARSLHASYILAIRPRPSRQRACEGPSR